MESMEVKLCRNCGKMINYRGFGPVLCGMCASEEEKLFRRVRDYLYDHPNAKLEDTAAACGVKKALIQQWCKEDSLQYSSPNATGLYCSTCGTPICSGMYCEKCLEIKRKRENMARGTGKHVSSGAMRFRRSR